MIGDGVVIVLTDSDLIKPSGEKSILDDLVTLKIDSVRNDRSQPRLERRLLFRMKPESLRKRRHQAASGPCRLDCNKSDIGAYAPRLSIVMHPKWMNDPFK